ncbi:organic cation transporter protein-like isoform X2 [Halichondria panicea]|uniref:organic cation transporter protein-like isoform X2 n=1 Tax=Halichondria panicea TaxID=6063 RepID=UPI00312B6DCA
MEVEEVLRRIGFGGAQKRLYILIQTIHYASVSHFIALSFIGFEPQWTCGDKTELDAKCLEYARGDCKPHYLEDVSTIISEWNLLCDKSSLAKLSQSIFFSGAMLGAWLWGTLADRIGRRKIYFTTVVLTAAMGLGYSVAPNYYIFVVFRFLVALSVTGLILSSYVLSIELTGTQGRTKIVMLSNAFYSLCHPLLATQAYLITDWRLFSSVSSLSGLLVLLLWRVIPESPRWLLVNGQQEEARAVLARLASDNGVEMPAGELKKPTDPTSAEPVSVLDLFRGKVIRRRTVILFVTWFANCLVYYALTMSAGELGGNRYVNIALAGLVEIPSYIAGYFLLDSIGRKRLHGVFLTSGGIACLAVACMQWFAELFPTQVRNIGAGVATIGARLGGFFAPIVLLLVGYGVGLPMLVLGSVGTLTGLLSFTLPETLGQPMPETLRELECQKF